MAAVQGIREKVHLPIYDSLQVESEKQLREYVKSSTIKFFVDVQNKTKLETNLQSASLLPHYNTFEARAMRVVISDLPPEFSEDVDIEIDGTDPAGADVVVSTNLKRAMELLVEARDDDAGATITVDKTSGPPLEEVDENTTAGNEEVVTLDSGDIESAIDDLDKDAPPTEQINSNNGSGNIISKLVYNTVTTLYVGEKIMIEMPTWFFPGGAGPYSFTTNMISHGEPTPLATFRFAEPIYIDRQQNFRVEMDIPDSDVYSEIQKIYGPLFIWVVLDGYMTRDVQ